MISKGYFSPGRGGTWKVAATSTFQKVQLSIWRLMFFISSLDHTFTLVTVSLLLGEQFVTVWKQVGVFYLAVDCGNLLVTRTVTSRSLVQHHISLCEQFHARNSPRPPATTNNHFPAGPRLHTFYWWTVVTSKLISHQLSVTGGYQMVPDRSLGLCNWGWRTPWVPLKVVGKELYFPPKINQSQPNLSPLCNNFSNNCVRKIRIM